MNMNTKIIEQNGVKIAVIESDEPIITDVQSTLDLITTMNYQHEATRIVLPKAAVCEEFFKLSTGVAGEILQKFITYGAKLAIVGNYSGYTSKPLHDFIYESNNGKVIFFVGSVDEAINKLTR
jgi:hypothetical protein